MGVLVLLLARPVPSGNEEVYLLAAESWWRPDALPGDWTFAHRWVGHGVFNAFYGALGLLIPEVPLAWATRLLAWLGLLLSIDRIGRRLGITSWGTVFVVLLFVVTGESIVGGEWLFGGIEAKVPAWIAGLWALDAVLADRPVRAGLLAGVSFSLHPSVGLAFGVGGLGALAMFGASWQSALKFLVAAIPTGLPGLAFSLGTLSAEGSTPLVWRYLTLSLMPYHFDPSSFPVRRVLLLAVLLWYLQRVLRREPHDRVLARLAGFVVATGLLFAAGVALRGLEWFSALQLMPFRVFPVILPLTILLLVWRELTPGGPRRRVGDSVVLILALAGFVDPLGGVGDRLGDLRIGWAKPDEFERTMLWIREHSPPDAGMLVTPMRRDHQALARRAVVVNKFGLRFDRLEEWLSRLGDLLPALDPAADGPQDPEVLQASFDNLSTARALALASKYQLTLLVTQREHRLPLLHREDSYFVYDLRQPGDPAPAWRWGKLSSPLFGAPTHLDRALPGTSAGPAAKP